MIILVGEKRGKETEVVVVVVVVVVVGGKETAVERWLYFAGKRVKVKKD